MNFAFFQISSFSNARSNRLKLGLFLIRLVIIIFDIILSTSLKTRTDDGIYFGCQINPTTGAVRHFSLVYGSTTAWLEFRMNLLDFSVVRPGPRIILLIS